MYFKITVDLEPLLFLYMIMLGLTPFLYLGLFMDYTKWCRGMSKDRPPNIYDWIWVPFSFFPLLTMVGSIVYLFSNLLFSTFLFVVAILGFVTLFTLMEKAEKRGKLKTTF